MSYIKTYSESYWGRGAKAARAGLSIGEAKFMNGLTGTYGPQWAGFRNGYEFAKAQIAKERRSFPTRVTRFLINTVHDPEGYLPGRYFYVQDRNTGLKVSRYVRTLKTAFYKQSQYEAKENATPGLPFPVVDREAELYHSRYAVPTAAEWFDVSMFISKGVAQGRRWDEDVQQYLSQAKRWKRRAHSEGHPDGNPFPVVDAPVRHAVVKDTGDVRPQSVGGPYPWIVVAIENPGPHEGLFWYVQGPRGDRLTAYTTEERIAQLWALWYKHTNDHTPQNSGDAVFHGIKYEDELEAARADGTPV